jgi:hypothetical protein
VGNDDGGPAGVPDEAPLVPALEWPSDAVDDTASALSMPRVDESVARLEMVAPVPARLVAGVVVAVESSLPLRPLVWSSLWLFDPGTVIPILANTLAAVSWAAPGRLPLAAAAPVADATVMAPAARSTFGLRRRPDVNDLRLGLFVERRARNISTASASAAASAAVAGRWTAATTSANRR